MAGTRTIQVRRVALLLLLFELLWAAAALAPPAAQRRSSSSSFLVKRRDENKEPGAVRPIVCDDWPAAWTDAAGRSCKDYNSDQLCLPTGDYGPGWKQEWGAFRTFGHEGNTALGACCACGGGWHSTPATCSYMECPEGFRVKDGKWNIFCKDLKCTLDEDLWTCCDAHPDVKQAVEEIQREAKAEEEVVRQQIRLAAAKEVERLGLLAAGQAKELSEGFAHETKAAREQAIAMARAQFATATQHRELLGAAASHQIRISSYITARDDPTGRVDTQALSGRARQATEAFARAEDAWHKTDDASHNIVSKGKHEWTSYYKDLNNTWPVIVHGINQVNEALKESTVPNQVVRWTEQAVRLASDQATITQGQMNGIDTAVTQAEERAAMALKWTTGNRGKIANLQDMVAEMKNGR